MESNVESTSRNLSRIRLICAVMALFVTTTLAASINWSWDLTWPGILARACSNQNSVRVRSMSLSFQKTSIVTSRIQRPMRNFTNPMLFKDFIATEQALKVLLHQGPTEGVELADLISSIVHQLSPFRYACWHSPPLPATVQKLFGHLVWG